MSRPALSTSFMALLRRDFLLAYRRRAELLQPLVFLLVVVTLFPLGVGPSPQLLAKYCAGGNMDCGLTGFGIVTGQPVSI